MRLYERISFIPGKTTTGNEDLSEKCGIENRNPPTTLSLLNGPCLKIDLNRNHRPKRRYISTYIGHKSPIANTGDGPLVAVFEPLGTPSQKFISNPHQTRRRVQTLSNSNHYAPTFLQGKTLAYPRTAENRVNSSMRRNKFHHL